MPPCAVFCSVVFCSVVCVVGFIYPATRGPRGHGSSPAAAEAAPVLAPQTTLFPSQTVVAGRPKSACFVAQSMSPNTGAVHWPRLGAYSGEILRLLGDNRLESPIQKYAPSCRQGPEGCRSSAGRPGVVWLQGAGAEAVRCTSSEIRCRCSRKAAALGKPLLSGSRCSPEAIALRTRRPPWSSTRQEPHPTRPDMAANRLC